MTESRPKAEVLRDRLEVLTRDILCLEEALEFVQMGVSDQEGYMSKLASGALGTLLTHTNKMSKESIEAELMAMELARN